MAMAASRISSHGVFEESHTISASAPLSVTVVRGTRNVADATSARRRRIGTAAHVVAYASNRTTALRVSADTNVLNAARTKPVTAVSRITTVGVRKRLWVDDSTRGSWPFSLIANSSRGVAKLNAFNVPAIETSAPAATSEAPGAPRT